MTEQTLPPLSRRERKKLETRNRILSSALTLFSRQSYDQVRVEDICEAADISNATFFAYFPTKASLITGFGADLLRQIRNRLNEFDVDSGESLELLRVIYFDEWADHRGLLKKVFSSSDSPEGAALAAAGSELIALVAEIIERGQSDEQLSSRFQAPLVAQCLVAGWRSVMIDFVTNGDAQQMTKNNREVLDIIMEGAA